MAASGCRTLGRLRQIHARRHTATSKADNARMHAPKLARPAGKWQRTRTEEGLVASDLERRDAECCRSCHAHTRTHTHEPPHRRGTGPIWRLAKSSPVRWTYGEISVEPFASRRDDYVCAGQRRPQLEVPQHKRLGATPEGVWMRGQDTGEASHQTHRPSRTTACVTMRLFKVQKRFHLGNWTWSADLR